MADASRERHLDYFLGERAPTEPTRDDVLAALREHVLGTFVLEYEREPDGEIELHVEGTLVEADRDNPETWETAEQFVIVSGGDAQMWHLAPEFREHLAETGSKVPGATGPIMPLAFLPEVPQEGIEEYLGTVSCTGYRWPAGQRLTAAMLLWHDISHVTETGDVAPGLGSFRVVAEDEDDSGG